MRRFSTLIKLLLTAGLIWWIAEKVDLGAAWSALRRINGLMLAAAWLLLIAQQFCGAFRWLMILRALDAKLTYGKVLNIFYIAGFLGIVLPGALGFDAVRIWKTLRAGVPAPTIVNSLVIERIATILGLVLLASAGLLLLGTQGAAIPARWFFPSVAGLAILAVCALACLDRLPSRLAHLPPVHYLSRFALDTRRVFFRPLTLVPMLGATIAAHALACLCVYVLARGLGASVSVVDCLALVPAVILIGSLPISISGWGARELAMVTAFGFVGVPGAQALAASVLFGVGASVAVLPGGLLWLVSRSDRAEAINPA